MWTQSASAGPPIARRENSWQTGTSLSGPCEKTESSAALKTHVDNDGIELFALKPALSVRGSDGEDNRVSSRPERSG